MARLPHSAAPVLFGALVTGPMTLIVAGVSTWMAMGLAPEFPGSWMRSWLTSWAVAFPVILFVAPLVRRIVAALVQPPASPAPSTSARPGA
jgi:hypothetical protein